VDRFVSFRFRPVLSRARETDACVARGNTQNSAVYVGVIIGGALVGEKALNYGFDRAWESANKGKLWKDVAARLELEE
jgi:ubiquinol-cytochrome c reductase subunit 9